MLISRKHLLLVFMLVCSLAATAADAKDVVGWLEYVKLFPGGLDIKAKLDSGAKTSSLHCQCITPIKRGDEDWVSFSVHNAKGETIRLEKPIRRIARIKQHSGESQKRYVISLGICLGNVYREDEVTLVDRSGFNYPMLIGRNFLKGEFLIDPGQTYKSKASCKVPPEK